VNLVVGSVLSVILIDGNPAVTVAEALEESPTTCAAVGDVDDDDGDDAARLLVFFLPTVPPTAPPTTAPMITKATIMPMTILPVVDPQNDVLLLPSGGFSLRRSYELNDLPTAFA